MATFTLSWPPSTGLCDLDMLVSSQENGRERWPPIQLGRTAPQCLARRCWKTYQRLTSIVFASRIDPGRANHAGAPHAYRTGRADPLSPMPERAPGKLPPETPRRAGGLLVQTLTTDELPLRQRYAFWKEAVCDMFVGIDCSRSADDPFRGAAVRRSLEWSPTETASFIEVDSIAQSAVRSQRHIRRARDAWI